jgi:hypothetical protein
MIVIAFLLKHGSYPCLVMIWSAFMDEKLDFHKTYHEIKVLKKDVLG